MVFVWYLYGICMVFVLYLYGICIVFVWYLYGMCMVFVLYLYGLVNNEARQARKWVSGWGMTKVFTQIKSWTYSTHFNR